MHTNSTTYYNLPQFVGTDIVNDLTDTNGAYSAIDSAIHEVASSAAAESAKIATLETQNGDSVLTTTAQTLSGAVNEIDEEINGTNGLSGKVSAVEADVVSLNSQVGTLGGDISALQTSVSTNTAAIGTNTTAIGTINTKLGSDPLVTTAQTITGAINEVANKTNPVTVVATATADGVKTYSQIYDSLFAQLPTFANEYDILQYRMERDGSYLYTPCFNGAGAHAMQCTLVSAASTTYEQVGIKETGSPMRRLTINNSTGAVSYEDYASQVPVNGMTFKILKV